MPRYFTFVSEEELRIKITNSVIEDEDHDLYDPIHYKNLTPTVEKDLSKVEFDTENIDAEDGYYENHRKVVGYHTLDNGFTFLGVIAGGDWEWPVFFCIYWDGSKLRGYIPTEGNLWNTDTNRAYGNDEESDEENIQKRFPGADPDDLQLDPDKIIEDLKKRIRKRFSLI